MLNIPSEVKALFQQDGVHKNFHVHFPNGDATDLNNEDIISESVEFTESLCSQQYFKFGLAEASQIEFTSVGTPNILGSTIECAMEIDCTSLGTTWANNHPKDTSLPWLQPQTCYVGETYETGGDVSASGGRVDASGLVFMLRSHFPIVQQGEGVPSPDNVRNIVAMSGVGLTITQGATQSTTYFDWSSTARYIYDADMDYTSGVLTTDYPRIDLSSLTWQASNTSFTFYAIVEDVLPVYSDSTDVPDMYCSHYAVVSFSDRGAYDQTIYRNTSSSWRQRIFIRDKRFNNSTQLNEFVASLSGVTLVVKSDTVQTYQLTPLGTPTVAANSRITHNRRGLMYVGYTLDSALHYRVPYGRFIVDSCPRDHGNMFQRKVVAYTATPIKNEQVINGQYPVSSWKLNMLYWMATQDIDWSKEKFLMVNHETISPSSALWAVETYNSKTAAEMSDNELLGFTGISPRSYPRLYMSSSSGTSRRLGVYAIHIEYNEHEFDNYSAALFAKALSAVPSGSFVYESYTDVNPDDPKEKVYNSTAQAVASSLGCFSPSCRLVFHYMNDPYIQGVSKVSKPIFFKNGDTLIIDFRDFEDAFSYFINRKSAYPGFICKLEFTLPMAWFSTATWRRGVSETSQISGWDTTAPFDGRTSVYRDGNAYFYYKDITDVIENVSIPSVKLANTLKFTKNSTLGEYYTYANAASALGLVEGALELTGSFMRVTRAGEKEIFNISENQAVIPVGRSEWSEFWWDENEVEPIGQVNVKCSTASGEDSEMTEFTIGAGKSIYTMEENAVLNNTTASAAEIQTTLETYFEPNAEVINFTPVDLTMKGLPYLEAGDKIQLTADDGTTVETFILEQTISGIQHLVADVTSTNGELLEVTEE